MKVSMGLCVGNTEETLRVALIGNQSHIGIYGYTPCLEIICNTEDDAKGYIGKKVEIRLNEDRLIDTDNISIKAIYISDCKIKVICDNSVNHIGHSA